MPDPANGANAFMNLNLSNGYIWELIVRFALNLFIAFIIIRYSYYRNQKNDTYSFTYYVFNVLIFFVCYLLSNVTLSIGFAFGLFAIFAILRYRTLPIPIKEMTYLFMVITVGVINALSTPDIGILELLFTNIAIVVVVLIAEYYWMKNSLEEIRVVYKQIENIKAENHGTLLADLRERTGLDIVRFKIRRISFRRGTARIQIYYKRGPHQNEAV